jgi:hypothetical protein
MRHKQYALALIFEEEHNTSLLNTLRGLFTCLKNSEIVSKAPKMGEHLTILPPFEASEDEAGMLSLGIGIMRQLVEHNYNGFIIPTFQKEDFFENATTSTVVLRYSVNDRFKEMVSSWRMRFGERFTYVYPPESFFFNPHITIAECPQITKKEILSQISSTGNRTMWERLITSIKQTNVYLSNLRVMQKTSHGWVPVSF